MQPLNFPEYDFRIRISSDRKQIFDPVRKKFVSLSPEEWVRQHLIQYLSIEKRVPMHMIACEKGLLVNRKPQRFDLVIFGRDGLPLLIAECKAPTVKLTEDTFYQVARYNLALKVKYLLVSNGLQHFFGAIDYHSGNPVFEDRIPEYLQLCDATG